jgi:hypothetical protein
MIPIYTDALQASSLSRLSQLHALKLDFENHLGSPARINLRGLPSTLYSLTLSANNALMIAGLPAIVPKQVNMRSTGAAAGWRRIRYAEGYLSQGARVNTSRMRCTSVKCLLTCC